MFERCGGAIELTVVGRGAGHLPVDAVRVDVAQGVGAQQEGAAVALAGDGQLAAGGLDDVERKFVRKGGVQEASLEDQVSIGVHFHEVGVGDAPSEMRVDGGGIALVADPGQVEVAVGAERKACALVEERQYGKVVAGTITFGGL